MAEAARAEHRARGRRQRRWRRVVLGRGGGGRAALLQAHGTCRELDRRRYRLGRPLRRRQRYSDGEQIQSATLYEYCTYELNDYA